MLNLTVKSLAQIYWESHIKSAKASRTSPQIRDVLLELEEIS